jgi:hypothetical protein
MRSAPCEACGRPRGRGARCKECGYDRYATRLHSSGSSSSRPSVEAPASSGRPREASGAAATKEAPRSAHRARPSAGSEPASSNRRPTASPRPSASTAPRTPSATPAGPTASGRVLALSATKPASGDRPRWVAGVYVLAFIPVLVIVAVIVAVHAAMQSLGRAKDGFIRSPFRLSTWISTPQPSSSTSALLKSAFDALLSYRQWQSSSTVTYSEIRLRESTSQRACRYLASPDGISVVLGDELKLWGTVGSDGVLRANRLENVSTGSSHSVALVPPLVVFGAVIAAFFCLMVLASAI